MENQKNDNYYIDKMCHLIEILEEYIETLNTKKKVISRDDQDSDVIAYKLIQLKEAASGLSEDFLNSHPSIQKDIHLLSGFRNRLVHDYDNVAYNFFDEILEIDLPHLKKELLDAKEKKNTP